MASRAFKLQLKDAAGKELEGSVEATVTPQGLLLAGGPVCSQLSPLTWAKLLRVRARTRRARHTRPNIPGDSADGKPRSFHAAVPPKQWRACPTTTCVLISDSSDTPLCA